MKRHVDFRQSFDATLQAAVAQSMTRINFAFPPECTGLPHLYEHAPPLRPYHRPMPMVLGGSLGGGPSFMSEVPLYEGRQLSGPY